MLEFYVARHGQTEWNTQGRLQGWLNSPLTSKGIDSAKALGNLIKHDAFDAYYSSPSGRAFETLQIAMGSRQDEIIKDERLMEMGLGDWQGKLAHEIQSQYPEAYRDYFESPDTFMLEGAETYHDLKARVQAFIEESVENHFTETAHKKILIITHGVTLMMMRLIFNGGALEDLASYGVSDNAKLHVFQFDGDHYKSILEDEGNKLAR